MYLIDLYCIAVFQNLTNNGRGIIHHAVTLLFCILRIDLQHTITTSGGSELFAFSFFPLGEKR